MNINDLVAERDKDSAQYTTQASLYLLGALESRFLTGIRGKAAEKLGFSVTLVPESEDNIQILRNKAHADLPFVHDYETFKNRGVVSLLRSHTGNNDMDWGAAGIPAVAEAMYDILVALDRVEGQKITLYGRGKAVYGFPQLLTESDATVNVAHSQTPFPQEEMLHRNVVIFATPKLDFSPRVSAERGQLFLDISGVAGELAFSDNWTYIGPREIGRLTTSILVNRFAHRYGRKKEQDYGEI